LRLRGWAYEISGEFDAANLDYAAELRTALETENSHAEWDALIRLAELWASRDYERAGEYVEQSLNLAEKINDQSLTAYSLNRMGNWYLNNDDPERARKYHERALEMFQLLGDRSGIATTEDLVAMTLAMGGNLIDGRRHFERARDLFQVVGDQQAICSILANLVHCGGIYQTDTMVPAKMTLDECIASVEDALKTAEGIGYRTGEVYALMCYCSSNGSRGNYQAAIDAVEHGIAGAQEIDHRQWLCAAYHLNGSLFLDLLDSQKASTHLEQALAIAREIGSRVWIRANAGLLALAELSMGQADTAATAFESAWNTDVSALTMAERYIWRAGIELAFFRNDPAGAIQLIDQMLYATPYARHDRPAPRLSLLRGRALNGLERFDEAISWLTPAQRVARGQGARPLLWRIHRELGIAESELGNRLRASEEFGQAHRLIDEIGATLADPNMKQRFLSEAHAQVPQGWAPTLLQSAKKSSGGLTRRQRQVAALIAAGSSNREIAEQLSISERTVETHVTAILSTLDLTSRAQIAAWCVENGLAEREPT
jgi:DNA-binding CsgD family transcriptional regulator/predicted negative regulator of RcsB-dependent stress response